MKWPTKQFALSGTSLIAMLVAAGAGAGTAQAQSGQTATADEVTVTGSSIRGVQPVGSPLISVTSEDVKNIGAATVPDLMATVPLLSSFNSAPVAGFGSLAPALRGLNNNATLPLINGHRMVGAAANTTEPDYPNIPALAMSRVEVVPDGASAVYGSDAVAGVVNFVTKRHANRVEASVRAGFAEAYHINTINFLDGHDWGSGSLLMAYERTKNDNITIGDRASYRTTNFTSVGGTDQRAVNCPSPNVRIAATGTTNYAYPALTVNTTNYCDPLGADLYPASNMSSGLVSLEQKVTDNITFWGDFLYSMRFTKTATAPAAQNLTITSVNPYFIRPPGTTVTTETVVMRLDGILGTDHVSSWDDARTANSTFGFDFKLPKDWKLSTYASVNYTFNYAYIPGVDTAKLATALTSSDPATAFDPFTNKTNGAIAYAIYNSPIWVEIDQSVYVGAAKLDGTLFSLPGGDVKVATGVERMHQGWRQRGLFGANSIPEDTKRDSYSGYGEVYIPIFGEGNAQPLMRNLTLSLSARYDHYSDFGGTTNPKVGLNWEPVQGFVVRSSYGTSFRAPGIRQLITSVGNNFVASTSAAVRDPTRTTQVNTLTLSGGNKGLQPETGESYSYGFDWRPTFLPGARASITYFNVQFANAIATPTAQQVFTDPAFASKLTRDPTTAQILEFQKIGVPTNYPTPLPAIGNLIDLRLSNIGSRDIDGIDFDFGYRQRTGFGAVTAALTGTYYLDYLQKATPSALPTNSLNLGRSPYSVRGTVGVNSKLVNASVSVDYSAGITNNYAVPVTTATPTGIAVYESDPYITTDLRLSRSLPDRGLTKGVEVSFLVDDVFNQKPSFFPSGDGTTSYNPLGRFFAVNIQKNF